MTRITLQAGALAVLAVFVGISTPTEVARADEPAPADAKKAKDWTEHMGDIPFFVGREAGEAEAEFTGKPPMYFFTTTW